jgi:hypothetical protein
LFKALLAASLAMLVCCAAAAWAGRVDPIADRDPPSTWSDGTTGPLQLVDPRRDEPAAPLLTMTMVDADIDGFVPISFSGTHQELAPITPPLSPEVVAALDPPARPAVIPLPPALYAGAAPAAAVVLLRRRLLRATR